MELWKDKENFRGLVVNAAKHCRVPEAAVEKDLYVIEALPAKGGYYRVTLPATGQMVQVNMSFTGAGDQLLTIDCAAQHCDINGASADPYVTLESDYFDLEPGPATIQASSGSATVRWTERWI